VSERICSVEDCDRPTAYRGYCRRHYYSFRRYGDPLTARRRKPTNASAIGLITPEWFWARVEIGKSDECWPWRKAKADNGYGHFTIKAYGTFAAHRTAYELENGPVPEGLEVCHRCDNKPCCNPGDLFAGTRIDNMQDMVAKGLHPEQRKTHCKRGHEFTAANTYIIPTTGGRQCLTCVRARSRRG
jgi:hypothetical protein